MSRPIRFATYLASLLVFAAAPCRAHGHHSSCHSGHSHHSSHSHHHSSSFHSFSSMSSSHWESEAREVEPEKHRPGCQPGYVVVGGDCVPGPVGL